MHREFSLQLKVSQNNYVPDLFVIMTSVRLPWIWDLSTYSGPKTKTTYVAGMQEEVAMITQDMTRQVMTAVRNRLQVSMYWQQWATLNKRNVLSKNLLV